MKVVIVEDILETQKNISKNTDEVLIENNLDINVICFDKYNKDLKRIIYNNEIKIYIIDVNLGSNCSKSGYDIAREIREIAHDWYSIIIICSAYNQKENFISARLSILTYLSKSDNFECGLKETIKLAINIINEQNGVSIDNKHQLYYKEILYALKEKYSKYCVIKTLDNEVRVRKNIYELEKELHLKKYRRHLLANEKNIATINDDEIIFKNDEKVEL